MCHTVILDDLYRITPLLSCIFSNDVVCSNLDLMVDQADRPLLTPTKKEWHASLYLPVLRLPDTSSRAGYRLWNTQTYDIPGVFFNKEISLKFSTVETKRTGPSWAWVFSSKIIYIHSIMKRFWYQIKFYQWNGLKVRQVKTWCNKKKPVHSCLQNEHQDGIVILPMISSRIFNGHIYIYIHNLLIFLSSTVWMN